MRALVAIIGASLLLFVACSDEETPEERVRSYVDLVAETAEARKWRSFEDYVADDYTDDRGLDKKDVLAIIARYILANQSIYILERIASVRIDDQHNARAVVYAAIAGQPVSDAEDLVHVTADFYRFEIDLRAGEDGVFRTRRGNWKPVGPEHFLIGR
ncbi:MAG: hypothetical protein LJE70_02020 [Chromatiaceae bacterium]|nr:hypothetical protein [Chromatiaceae bacterium]